MGFELEDETKGIHSEEDNGYRAGQLLASPIVHDCLNCEDVRTPIRVLGGTDLLGSASPNAARTIVPPTKRASRPALVCAEVGLKNCSSRDMPPRKKAMPITRSRLESMLPTRDALTTVISPFVSA